MMHIKTAYFASFAAAALLLCACSGNDRDAAHSTASPSGAIETNGEMIFQTGSDRAGKRITAVKPPLRPTCAACHNANGSGGVKFPGGAVSADLRHDAMVTKQTTPYTLALVERAISGGIDDEGKPLDPVMPRWKLSRGDLHDVAAYVLTLK